MRLVIAEQKQKYTESPDLSGPGIVHPTHPKTVKPRHRGLETETLSPEPEHPAWTPTLNPKSENFRPTPRKDRNLSAKRSSACVWLRALPRPGAKFDALFRVDVMSCLES